MRERFEQVVFVAIAVLSIVIPIADWIGALEQVDFIASRIGTGTLLMVGIVALYLITERRQKLDKIEGLVLSGTDDVVRSLRGVRVRRFEQNEELYDYVTQRLNQARKSVDDLTWGVTEEERTPASKAALDRYVEAMASVIRDKKRLTYREVMSFPPTAHLKRARHMLGLELWNYSLRFYEGETAIPLLAFIIIDAEEVILSSYRGPHRSSVNEIRLATTHPDIVAMFSDYYETIWMSAEKLKDAGTSFPEKLDAIERRLLTPSPAPRSAIERGEP